MAVWTHRITFQTLRSTPASDLQEPVANYVENPDLSAVEDEPTRYWQLSGDVFSLIDQAARDAVDAALLIAARNELADQIDAAETFLRGFALVVLDELNAHSAKTNAILDAIDAANNLGSLKTAIGNISNLPDRTASQIKTAVRNKLDT